ncbi:MAG: ParB N-terminal domain-containing protein [Atopobiaceae bacterium]|nr:ParB N-terminal domain-containing protein [Atopobiaceae bacterium]
MTETAPMHLETVPLDELLDHPDNDYPVREEELQDLLESIRRDGLAQLPLVRSIELEDGREMLQILSGHRRVECFRRLGKEDPEHYSTIPVNVISDCSDEHALILLDISNLMVRQLSPTERAKRFERLWKTVPELRKKTPELKGVRSSQIIADTITRETGQSISRASVDRALAAGRRAQEVEQLVEDNSENLYKGWLNEFKIREGFLPETVTEISSMDESTQQLLYADYQRKEKSPQKMARHLKRQHEKTDIDVEHSLDGIIKTLDTISAWKKKYGVAVDTYRVKYIRNQLTKLTRT